jgi:hypothetical protein
LDEEVDEDGWIDGGGVEEVNLASRASILLRWKDFFLLYFYSNYNYLEPMLTALRIFCLNASFFSTSVAFEIDRSSQYTMITSYLMLGFHEHF